MLDFCKSWILEFVSWILDPGFLQILDLGILDFGVLIGTVSFPLNLKMLLQDLPSFETLRTTLYFSIIV